MKDESSVEYQTYSANWTLFARRVAAISLVLALVFLATLVGPVVQNTILALIMAFLLIYPIRWVTYRTPLNYNVSVFLVFIIYLIVAVLIILYLTIPAINFLTGVMDDLLSQLIRTITFLENYTPDQGWITDQETDRQIVNLNFILEPLSRWIRGENLDQLSTVARQLLDVATVTAGRLGNMFINAFVVHILALVFLLEIPAGIKWVFDVIPDDHRREYSILIDRMRKLWTAYFRSNLINAVISGLLVWIQLTLMGIGNAGIMASIAGALALIPYLGGLISLPIIGLNAFFAGSSVLDLTPLWLALLTMGIFQLIAAFVGQVIYPKIAGDAVDIPMSAIILGIIIGGALGGILGVFLAPPIMGILRLVVDYVIRKVLGGDPYPGIKEPAYIERILLNPHWPSPPPKPKLKRAKASLE